MTTSAFIPVRRAAISVTLPLPANSAGSGFARRAVTISAMSAPAERASAFSSASRSLVPPSPKSSSTSSARSRSEDGPRLRLLFVGNAGEARNATALCGFALVVVRHGDRPGRHHGRDRVLVYHLGDGIFQQDDILIERLDLSLKLDAVDQVDGNLNVLLAQGVQEGVL